MANVNKESKELTKIDSMAGSIISAAYTAFLIDPG